MSSKCRHSAISMTILDRYHAHVHAVMCLAMIDIKHSYSLACMYTRLCILHVSMPIAGTCILTSRHVTRSAAHESGPSAATIHFRRRDTEANGSHRDTMSSNSLFQMFVDIKTGKQKPIKCGLHTDSIYMMHIFAHIWPR